MTPRGRGKENKPRQTIIHVHKPQTKERQSNQLPLPQQQRFRQACASPPEPMLFASLSGRLRGDSAKELFTCGPAKAPGKHTERLIRRKVQRSVIFSRCGTNLHNVIRSISVSTHTLHSPDSERPCMRPSF